MPLRAGGHHVAHDTPRWSFVSSAVRKGRSQAASLAPTERPLSALDPVTGDEFKAGRGARLATQIAGVWTDIAKLDAQSGNRVRERDVRRPRDEVIRWMTCTVPGNRWSDGLLEGGLG